MIREANEMDQAVSRTLRESLEKLQRTAEELNQAVNDLVSACASSRPANALPSMLRAQTSAASLGVSLEVLSRFVVSSLRPASPEAPERISASSQPAVELPPTQADSYGAVAEAAISEVVANENAAEPAPATFAEATTETVTERPWETVASLQASEILEGSAPAVVPEFSDFAGATAVEAPLPTEVLPEAAGGFDIASLPAEEQELHRRANRVAKVSMQDIKLLRPNDVRLGQENHDLCFRLREDLERAHKEYDRRFQTINGHPVDYFYDWLVEILADGDPHLLGEYPYPSAVLRH